MIEKLEKQLDSLDPVEREKALKELAALAESGEIKFDRESTDVNMHFHTFFSYNGQWYSPSKIAWLSKKRGLAAAGKIDFDVLDGLDEFYQAADMLNLRSSVGMETRVFVPEFDDKVINSPGEPGIAYHIGAGFASSELEGEQADFLNNLKQTAQQRNKGLIERVNPFLSPVELDYEKDVVPITPSGNATERHICLAYARKAAEVFPDQDELCAFWIEKLGADAECLNLPEGADIQALIRAMTMKRGGVGYVEPDAGAFPKMAEVNDFVLKCGAIPTLAWLNGLSDGEQEMERLMDVAIGCGVEAFNIIPDRNFTAGVEDEKLKNLQEVIRLAQERDLPIIVGTEMNSPGLKFVDDFGSAELSPYAGVFHDGAMIVYGHSIMQRKCKMGYTSTWARENFESKKAKNEFYRAVGKKLKPAAAGKLDEFDDKSSPDDILEKL